MGDTQLALMVAGLCEYAFNADQLMPLGYEERVNEVFAHLVSNPRYGFQKPIVLRGGLSPTLSKLITEYIREAYHESITLVKLASLADLSEFHLQRMFKHSHGISPQAYLTELELRKPSR